MILPQTYLAALLVLILSVLCLGSWANTFKLASKWRYELYYVDWAFGAIAAAVAVALTFGSLGYDGFSFRDDMLIASKRAWLFGFLAGALFNLGNILLMAALSVAGMAIAFPIGLGVSMILGAVVDFVAQRTVPLTFVLLGCALLLAGVAAAALSYRNLLALRHEEIARAGKAKSTRRPSPLKPILLTVVGGLLLGSFAPLLDRAKAGEIGLGPYSLGFLFALGAFLSTFMYDLFLMNLPVDGEPLEIPEYFRGTIKNHLLGVVGGALWGLGMVAGFVALAAPQSAHPGRAIENAVGASAVLVAALWGIFAWKELRGGDGRVNVLASLMLLLIAGGIVVLAIAPLYAAR